MPMPKHLKSIGLHVFISEYEYFASSPQKADAIDYLVQKGVSNESGASIRVSNAKCLFADSKLLGEALEYVAYKAKRATSFDRERAIKLLNSLE